MKISAVSNPLFSRLDQPVSIDIAAKFVASGHGCSVVIRPIMKQLPAAIYSSVIIGLYKRIQVLPEGFSKSVFVLIVLIRFFKYLRFIKRFIFEFHYVKRDKKMICKFLKAFMTSLNSIHAVVITYPYCSITPTALILIMPNMMAAVILAPIFLSMAMQFQLAA